VHIVRRGSQRTVHFCAYLRYRGNLKSQFDALIDEVNTIPFFTPLWADIPHFMFIHQLAREVWWEEASLPLSAVGYLAEPLYLRVYRRRPVFTVSDSTRTDLRLLGFSGPITIVPEGLEPIVEGSWSKALLPTFVYVGRLSPSKRISHIIHAFAEFQRNVGPSELRIIGQGPARYVRQLHRTARKLGVEEAIRFLGWIPRADKHRNMAEAHALLMASVREGWGLVVTEANALGTPAVVYDVRGLRDSVHSGRTGLTVAPTPEALTAGMLQLWEDARRYDRMAINARRWGKARSFDDSAATVRDGIACAVGSAAGLIPIGK
jgi:glycosyltransferase involved in cell wall biosynthesis